MDVRLDPLRYDDGEALTAANAASQGYHSAWVEPPRDMEAFDRWFGAMLTGPNHGWIARNGADIVGVVSLTQIVWGPFRSAFLGYYGMAGHERRGLMTEAVRFAVDEAFGALGLHRLEANIQPGNNASRALVRRLGFKQEGFSPNYLKVDGEWRDHERWTILSSDWAS